MAVFVIVTAYVAGFSETEHTVALTIRPMRDDEVDAISVLRCAAFFAGTERTAEIDAAGLRDLMRGDGYEIALVADDDGVAVGSVLLVRQELEAQHNVSPWLAGLVVQAGHRRTGVGSALVRAIEACAWARSVPKLHLYTGTAEGFYAARGWTVAERFVADGFLMSLMERCRPDGQLIVRAVPSGLQYPS